ncbi:MAG: dephospho-CoA kinase [Bacteroidetes bacterium]|nr:dephospho-CoA kinase [Bacteroidota bacterium]
MLKVGLTGNIGSGKSVVASVFKTLHIPVYNSDEKAAHFMDSPEITEKIKNIFGITVFNNNEKIDKKKLAQIVFSDAKMLSVLNNIIHPVVMNDFDKWVSIQNDSPYLIMESAILYSTGIFKNFDKIIFVSAPENIRINRVIKRDGITKSEVLKRMNNQIKEEDQINKADFIIINDDKTLVVPQILNINKLLTNK